MKFDGVHQPRPNQLKILEWIEKNRKTCGVLGIQAPTGLGKSAILRSLCNVIITPTNHLIDQYSNGYPDINILKGAEHYTCKKVGDCSTAKVLLKKTCIGCPHKAAKEAAKAGSATIANPISYYYLTLEKGVKKPSVLGIDEADKLEDMLRLTATLEIEHKFRVPPKVTKASDLLPWLEATASMLLEGKKYGEAGRYQRVAQLLEAHPTNFKVVRKATSTVLFPLSAPSALLENVTNAGLLILMSATLLESDVAEIAGKRKYKYMEIESSIPIDSRKIIYRPIGSLGRPDTPSIVKWIKQNQKDFPTRGSICHLTYGLQKAVKKSLPDTIINTPSNKPATVKKLTKDGGLWLASGAKEGVDLKDDIARLNMIPVIPYQYLGDPVVKARMDQPGGAKQYAIDAIKSIIQQAGRTTRGDSDHSVTIIGDPRFPNLVNRYRKELPKSFLESIVWREKK